MIRFVAILIVSTNLSWLVLSYSMLQAQQIGETRQDLCIVPGSSVHRVYNSMLASVRREVAEWDEFKDWSDKEMPIMAPSIDAHRRVSQAHLRELESASVCSGAF